MRKSNATLQGLKLQVYQALRKNSILHFDNAGKYGIDFEEIKIQYNGHAFRVIRTDGFKDTIIGHVSRLKEAVSLGHLELTRFK